MFLYKTSLLPIKLLLLPLLSSGKNVIIAETAEPSGWSREQVSTFLMGLHRAAEQTNI